MLAFRVRDNRDMSERRQRRRSEPVPGTASSESVAERLEELSLGEVERVIERAIEMQSATDGPAPDAIDREMLGRIADELDIDRNHLEQALREEAVRIDDEDASWFDRNVFPHRMSEKVVAPGDLPTVASFVDEWMGRHEGLRKRRTDGDAVVWERDEGLVVAARMGLKMSQGSGKLRSIDDVTTSVQPLDEHQQVVTIDADLTNRRRILVALLGAAAGLGVVSAGAAGVAADPTSAVVAGTVTTAVFGGGLLLGFRLWADDIRRALRRTADAIANPSLHGETESMPGTIRRLYDEWRGRGSTRPPR